MTTRPGLERRCLIEAYDWTSPANWASERNTELQDDLPSMPIYTWDGVPGWSRLADEPVPTEWGFPKTKINADGSITPPRLGVGRYRMQVRGPKQNSEWLDFKIKRGDEIHFESQDSDAGITLKQVPGRQP